MSKILTGKKIYLCTPDLKPITVLNGVDTESVSYSEHLRDYSSLTFNVDEYVVINGKQVKSNGYDELDVYMYLYLEDIAFFQMQYPSVSNDGQKEVKSITAYSIDKEWEDKDWVNFRVNTGEDSSLERLVEDNTDDLGFTINYINFYNPKRHDLSLLHIVLEKMPHWSADDADIDPLLWNKRLSFSEDSINLYALMNSVIAPKAECVFMFDCLHRKIKAYHKQNLDFDTNIFIGFRNLSSQIDQSVNEDSVFTRFNVAGGNDLTINDWNYNNGRIVNIDYFLREPYMSEEQADKFMEWLSWQDANREQFAEYAQIVSDLESKIYDLKYRVPDDGLDIDQWKGMNKEGLEESLKYYQSLLSAFEVSVDANPTYTGSNGKIYHKDNNGNFVDAEGEMIPSGITLTYNAKMITVDGKEVVDYESYMNLLYQMENGKSGYYTYYEIVNYIVPNIETALHNLTVPTEDDEQELDDSWETNWELYGLYELEGRLEDYEGRLEALAEYAEADPQGDAEYQQLHNEYVEIKGVIGDEETDGSLKNWIKKRNDEIAEIGEEERPYNLLRMQMVAMVSMYGSEVVESESKDYSYDVIEVHDENGELVGNSEWGFTLDDIKLFNILIHDTDYTNENILTTSLNTTSTLTSTETIIDKEKELLDDALEKLSEISQPQITFSVSMDNIMQIKEFENLRDDCSLLRFIRLGIRDDYSVKLRIVGRSWNPCEVTEDFTLEFSNMVTSTSGRSDLTDILNNSNGSAGKNSITLGSGNSDSDKEYAANLLALMVNSGLFSSAVAGVGVGTDEAKVNELIDTYLRTNVINESSFNKIFSRYIDVDNLVADAISTATISTDQITDGEGHTFADLVNSNIDIGSITTNIIQGRDGDGNYYIDLLAGEIAIDRLVSSDGKTAVEFVNGAVSTETIYTNLITDKNGDNQFYIDLLTGTMVENQIFSNGVTALSIDALDQNAARAKIINLVSENISVADLQAGDIVLSNQMRILTESEATEGIVMSGSEIQFLDENGDPSISIGYNTVSDGQGGTTVDYSHPAIVIKDENGSVLLNSEGLSQNDIGIAPMIQNHTIDEGKLTFDFIKTANGDIVVQNYDGTTSTWGRVITEYINDIDEKLEVPSPVDVDVLYAYSNSNESAPKTGWGTTAPYYSSGRYVWEKVVTIYENNSSSYTTPVCIQPNDTEYISISEQYYKSTSDSSQDEGSWTTTKPTFQDGYYIWTRSKIEWANGETTYSTPILATPDISIYTSTINTINDIATQDENGNWSLTQGVMNNTYVYTDQEHNNAVSLSEFASSITTTANAISLQVQENHADVLELIDLEESKRKAMYGTCPLTIANEANKKVQCENFELYTGATISVEFRHGNTEENPTLNVNGTGAIPVKSFNNQALTTEECDWKEWAILDFIYDGTSWRLIDNGMVMRVSAAEARIDLNSDSISAMVSVDGETSSISLTQNMLEAITNQFIVKSPDGTRTVISGGLLATDAIQSNNYIAPTGEVGVSGTAPYSVDGTLLDLTNGNIYTPNFMLDSVNGNAYLSGTIETGAGHIGGFTITESSIYNNMTSIDDEVDEDDIGINDSIYLEIQDIYVLDENDYLTSESMKPVLYGVYIGIDGIALGRGRFRVDANGEMYANRATIVGNITATSGRFGLNNGYYEISTNGLVGYKPIISYYFKMMEILDGIECDDGSVEVTDLSVETENTTYSYSDIMINSNVKSIGAKKEDGNIYVVVELLSPTSISSLFDGTIERISCSYTYEVNEELRSGSGSAIDYAGSNTSESETIEVISGTELGYDYLKTDRLVAADGLAITDGVNVLATYGASTVLGIDGSSRFTISPTGIHYTNSIGNEIYSLTRNINQTTDAERHKPLKTYDTENDVEAESLHALDGDITSSGSPYIELSINNGETSRFDSPGITIQVNDAEGLDVSIGAEGVEDILDQMRYTVDSGTYFRSTDSVYNASKVYYSESDGEYSEVVLNPVSDDWYEANVVYTLSTDTTIDSSKTYYVQIGVSYSIVNYNPVENGWYEREESYELSEDMVIDSSKTYYREESGNYVLINLNPSSNGWYESVDEYVLSTDTVVNPDKTYYEVTTDGYETSYSVVEIVGGENPSTEGWYEFVGIYRLSTDTFVVNGKLYYQESDSTYTSINLKPIVNGWYEVVYTYTLSEDEVYDNNKTYYSEENSSYFVVIGNPSANNWYEADVEYIESEDTSYNAEKTYYRKDGSDYVEISTIPTSNNWWEYSEDYSNHYYPCTIYVCYVAKVSTSAIMTLKGSIDIDSLGYALQITNNQWSATSGTDTMMRTTNASTGISAAYGVGSGGYNHGVWSSKLANWIIYADQNGMVRIPRATTFEQKVYGVTGIFTNGYLQVINNSTGGAAVYATNNGRSVALHSANSGYRGIFDSYKGQWLIYSPTGGGAVIPQSLTISGATSISQPLSVNGTVWVSSSGEAQVGVKSGAGRLYMYSQAKTDGNRGLFGSNAGGASQSYLYITQSGAVGIPQALSTNSLSVTNGINAGSTIAVYNANGAAVRAVCGSYNVALHSNTAGNRGVYDSTSGASGWIIYKDKNKNVVLPSTTYMQNTYNQNGQFHLADTYAKDMHFSTMWKDGEYHNVVWRPKSTAEAWFGYSSATTVIRGSSCRLKSATGTVISSDRNIKKDIKEYDERYDIFYDNLKPITYKYINGTSGRDHSGFISQDVRDALVDAGLTTNEFGGYSLEKIVTREEDNDRSDNNYLLDHGINEFHQLVYSEFIALNTWQVQKLKARVSLLEKELEELKRKIQ